MPRRASWAARIVPDAPPPTIATGARSDFVVRPVLRVGRARLALHHMHVHSADRSAGGLGEQAGHDGVDQARTARSNQPGADRDCANAVACPAHPERARMLQEHTVDISRPFRLILLRSHSPDPSKFGDPDRIRTCGPQIRNLMLYPAELRV